ncbi:hypothetical protein Tco_1414666, partial [Tanacetum coccineum]
KCYTVAVSPTTDSPGYIAESNPNEDEEDPEEDPTDYPADGGDDDDDDDELFDDDEDDDDDVDVEEDEDEEEEKEHPALADSVPPPIARLLAIPSPPPSPLSPWSSPLPQIPSPPLPVSSLVPVSPLPLPASPTYPLGYRATMIQLRAETPSTSHPLPSSTPPSRTPPLLPIPLLTLLPPLLLPSTVCRAGVSEVTLPPQKREDYGFVATLDDEIRRDPERDDTDEIYERLDDAQVDRSLMSGRFNMLYRDRRAHASTARLMETEARLSCEAWVQSTDASDTTRSMVRALRTTVLAQQTEIAGLRAVDRT